MTTLRTTVILETDISGSTARFRALPEADRHALLVHHRELLGRHAAAHDGRIVKPEGDGYWMTFPFKRLRRVDVTLRSPRHAGIEVYRLEPA